MMQHESSIMHHASKILLEKEYYHQKFLPEKNVAIKSSYRKRIWLSKNLTKKEFGSKISLLDILPKLNTLNISLHALGLCYSTLPYTALQSFSCCKMSFFLTFTSPLLLKTIFADPKFRVCNIRN